MVPGHLPFLDKISNLFAELLSSELQGQIENVSVPVPKASCFHDSIHTLGQVRDSNRALQPRLRHSACSAGRVTQHDRCLKTWPEATGFLCSSCRHWRMCRGRREGQVVAGSATSFIGWDSLDPAAPGGLGKASGQNWGLLHTYPYSHSRDKCGPVWPACVCPELAWK